MTNDEAMLKADIVSKENGCPVNIAFEDGDYSVMMTVDDETSYVGVGDSWEEAFNDLFERTWK